MDYVKAHWDGKLPLWQAYWVNVLFGPLFFGIALSSVVSSTSSVLLAALGLVFVIALTVWGYVGAWRSATAYVAAWPGARSLLGYLAYGAIAVGWFKFFLAVLSMFSGSDSTSF